MTYISALNLNKIDLVSTNSQSNVPTDLSGINLHLSNLDFDVDILETEMITKVPYLVYNAGISNLYAAISNIDVDLTNYVTLDTVQTIENKNIDFFQNNCTNFSNGGSGGIGNVITNSNLTLANYIPYWNGDNSTTLANGILKPTGSIVGTTDSQTITNKIIDYNTNTLENLPFYDDSTLSNNITLVNNRVNSNVLELINLDIRVDNAEDDITDTNNAVITANAQISANSNNLATFSNIIVDEIDDITTLIATNITDISNRVIAPPTNTANYLPQWNGTNSKTLKDGIDLATLSTISGSETLTNKILTSTTNDIAAKGLLSATTNVDIFNAAAPSSNQVLTATSSTTAEWKTPSSGGGGSGTTIYDYTTPPSISNIYNPYTFRVYSSNTQSNNPINTWFKVNLETIDFDLNSNYDTTLSKYIVPISGYYNLTAKVSFNGGSSNLNIYQSRLLQNSSNVLATAYVNVGTVASGSSYTVPIFDTALLTIGDVIELEAYMTNYVTLTASTGVGIVSLSSYLVAPLTKINYNISTNNTQIITTNLSNTDLYRSYITSDINVNTNNSSIYYNLTNNLTNTISYSSPNIILNNTSIVITRTGYYDINCSIAFSHNIASYVGPVSIYLRKNIAINTTNEVLVFGKVPGNTSLTTYVTVNYENIIFLTAGETISFLLYAYGTTGNIVILGGSSNSYMTIKLISPVAYSEVTKYTPFYNPYQELVSNIATGFAVPLTPVGTINLDSKLINISPNNFNTTTYKYTAPFSGYFLILGSFYYGGTNTTAMTYRYNFLKNSTGFAYNGDGVRVRTGGGPNAPSYSFSDVIYLAFNDTLALQVKANLSSNNTIIYGIMHVRCISNSGLSDTPLIPLTNQIL